MSVVHPESAPDITQAHATAHDDVATGEPHEPDLRPTIRAPPAFRR